MNKEFIYFSLIGFIVFCIGFSSAAHFIVGPVNDALDGTSANGKTVVLWNPSIGLNDNITDIVGPSGNSGANNIYFFDCELLNRSCDVGDTLRVKVLDSGDNHITNFVQTAVTGAGFDLMPNLTLNSPPSVGLFSPVNYSNFSSNSFNLSCNASDLDADLNYISLYGDFGFGWHLNSTISVSGAAANVNFSVNLSEGRYNWSCLAGDDVLAYNYASENRSFIIDNTSPNITEVKTNSSSFLCGTNYVQVTCNVSDVLTGISNVFIEAISAEGGNNYSSQILVPGVYYRDINVNATGDWTFRCHALDYVNNSQNGNVSIQSYSTQADLTIFSSEIVIRNPVEAIFNRVNATIRNIGCDSANNFLVGFFDGSSNSNQFGINHTISVPARGSVNLSEDWFAYIGNTALYVSLDLNNSITEAFENNNINFTNISVIAWQNIFGNVSAGQLLSDNLYTNFSSWRNETNVNGNVYMSDSESDINWGSLFAIGKNKTGHNSINDFSEIDSLLGMNGLNDSVSNLFSLDGSLALNSINLTANNRLVNNTPVINSSTNYSFRTGILWDGSDDTNGEYDSTDKEDIVFASKINKGALGAYGNYDYELRIPAKLREYDNSDTIKLFIYFDLN